MIKLPATFSLIQWINRLTNGRTEYQTECEAYLEAVPRLIEDLWSHVGRGATHCEQRLCHLHSQAKVTQLETLAVIGVLYHLQGTHRVRAVICLRCDNP